MDDKLTIALIAAGSSIAGVLVSSVVSYLLSSKTERLKSSHAAADFLRHKISVLESLKRDILEHDSTRTTIEDDKVEMAAKAARLLEDSFLIYATVFEKGGHFLPKTQRETGI